MPTLAVEYATDAERLALEQAVAFVTDLRRLALDTPAGPLAWDGGTALRFDPDQRYVVVVAAVCDGWCGVLDTAAGVLDPVRCDAAATSP